MHQPLARLVRQLRMDHGLSQKEVADRVGVERSYIGHIETGRTALPSRDVLIALARVLETTENELLAAAGYLPQHKTPPPPRKRSPQDILRELEESTPIMVSETSQPASAGAGIAADAEQWPYWPPPGERQHRHIAVEVTGDCLVPRLLPGQRAIVNLDASPRHGDIVLAIHDGEAILGHAQVSTTLGIYAHILPDAKREALDKLGELLVGQD